MLFPPPRYFARNDCMYFKCLISQVQYKWGPQRGKTSLGASRLFKTVLPCVPIPHLICTLMVLCFLFQEKTQNLLRSDQLVNSTFK